MTMTLPELDATLADWQQKMGTIAQNLYDFEALPTYQRLMGVGGMPKARLTGISKQKVDGAIADFTQLYQLFALFKETIDRATTLRSQVPKRGAEPLIADIESLLKGASIALPIQLIPIQTRDILGAASVGDRVTLETLLSQMSTHFTQAKAVILEVDAVWNHLEQQLINLQIRSQPIIQELTTIIQTAPTLVSVAIQQALSEFQTQFLTVHDAIDQDPLTANEGMITQLEPSLKAMQTHLVELQAQRQAIQRSLDDGMRSLQVLRSNHQIAITQFSEWQDKIIDPQTQVVIPTVEVMTELTQWLDRLTKTLQTGNALAVQVGISRWQTQFNLAQTQTQTAIEKMTQNLQYRIELRGRLSAMKAKASAMGRAEDPILSTIETQAHQQLYSRPTDLQRSQQLVGDYERSVNLRI
jgi:hypothetical protein